MIGGEVIIAGCRDHYALISVSSYWVGICSPLANCELLDFDISDTAVCGASISSKHDTGYRGEKLSSTQIYRGELQQRVPETRKKT